MPKEKKELELSTAEKVKKTHEKNISTAETTAEKVTDAKHISKAETTGIPTSRDRSTKRHNDGRPE